MRFLTAEQLVGSVGVNLGRSRSIVIDQQRIDTFADVTCDRQWIHVDPERAASGPYGAPIAHGYLTLSLVSYFLADLFDTGEVSASRVNYGLNKVRFPAPVPVGSSLSATGHVAGVEVRGSEVKLELMISIEREGGNRPVCVAEPVVLVHLG